MEGFLLQSKNTLEINTDPGGTEEAWERLAAGITDMEPDPNEEIAQDNYFDGDGFGESDVTGAQLIVSISGHRKYDDPAQNYIYGLQMELGPARRTEFRLTLPDGSMKFSTSRSEEHTSELQSRGHLVCRLLLEKKKIKLTYIL